MTTLLAVVLCLALAVLASAGVVLYLAYLAYQGQRYINMGAVDSGPTSEDNDEP